MASLFDAASQSDRFDGDYGGSWVPGFPARGVLHSTETTGLPSYKGGSVAPHFTVDPRTGKVWQHYSISRPSRALQHPPGTIDTNNAHAIQIEIIAYSDNGEAAKAGGLRVGQLTADQLGHVAALMRWVEANAGVKRASGLRWKSYPDSAGVSNGVRLSSGRWQTFDGWCGHQHVPNNDHGDPSDIDIAALLAEPEPQPAPAPGREPMYQIAKIDGYSANFQSDGKNAWWLQSTAERKAAAYQAAAFYGSPSAWSGTDASVVTYTPSADLPVEALLRLLMPGGFLGPVPPGWTLSADGFTLTPPA